MKKERIQILDCTLRDGGYITKWQFGEDTIREVIKNMIDANLDYVEVGYLDNKPYEEGSARFHDIDQIKEFLPDDRKNAEILAMADVTQFSKEDLVPCDGTSIDGIRVVFYKHQVEEALEFCKAVKENGYKLFVQPMVTIDYTLQEYTRLAEKINELQPYAVSIVDSFGYMTKEDFRRYFTVLDCVLDEDVVIGFHSHNNMQMAFLSAQDIMDYKTKRIRMIDASLYGMGRAAGNLHTELVTNYYNCTFGERYDQHLILNTISDCIMPISEQHKWGYSPYLFLTAKYQCHPNFAVYLLEEEEVSVEEFEQYLLLIPDSMRTKCKKPYVLDLYKEFKYGKLAKTS
ncbi:MAG: aldolase catalytic domain-containing protein [Lachnospiraceae bacterium]